MASEESDPRSADRLIEHVPEDVLGLCQRLRDAGKRGWIVGGCVRDLVLGRSGGDWDIATDARPLEVMRIFSRVIPTGIEHGTVTVLFKQTPYEVTTLRGETSYSDGRRPDSVTFVDDIAADLARRDFTINAMAIDPIDGKLIDPWEGMTDLRARVIRAVGNARERFSEDGLRPLRAARFAATLECTIDPATLVAIEPTLDTYRKVSAERIRDEWLKAMKARRPSVAFDVMRETGMLGITLPEMLDTFGCEQNRHHAYDVWRHSLLCMDECPSDPVLRVAAFLHDIGKPNSRAYSDKTHDYTFYEHDRIGAEMLPPILDRLRFSNDERSRIVALVRHHLVCYSDDWSDAAVRRWIRRVSSERTADLYALTRADALAKGRDVKSEIAGVEQLEQRVEAIRAAGDVLHMRDLAVNGRDLMQTLGIPPGRTVGELLEYLLEQVVEEPTRNTRETLLDIARARTSTNRGPGA